jgi:hypothetical protein
MNINITYVVNKASFAGVHARKSASGIIAESSRIFGREM